MAAAMGFSSFGAQNPNKRRKFNPGADAVVDGSPIPLHGRSAGGPKSTLRSGSGSNTTPLGVRVSNSDEIDLDGDLDTAAAATAAPPDVLPHHHEHEDGHDHDDPAPQYLDTSRPSATLPGNGEDNVQSKIDAIVGGSSAVNASISTSSFGDRAENGPRRGRGGFQSNRGRGRDPSKKWWEDYYDPSSLVNPWEKAEQALGLEPRGRWMSWDEAKAAQK
ncbi:hypothetical protein GGR56DRAFT_673282 [Xylariaceae sp. FL0804]|nr:hypothetical protein GGR56DRAFT_673282 [Xylariaceae sp. FL0804]